MKKLFYILIYIKQIQIFRLHIEIFLMVVCLLECSGFIPDIDLQGTEYMNNGVVIFQFNCSSNIGFKGCTIEGMLDNRTHDNIRYANQECFHKDGKCTLECCECSSDCKVFIWNVTILKNTVNNSFGCQSRIEADGITYKAMVLIRHNSSGFSIPNKTVVPIKGYNPIITIRPSISDVPSGTKIGWKISTLIILPVLLVVSIVLCIFIIRCVRLRKHKYKVTHDSMSIDQDGKIKENDKTELNTTAMHSNSVIINNADAENKVETTTFPPNTISIKQYKDPPNLETSSDTGTERPHFTTSNSLEIESNRNTEIRREKSAKIRWEVKRINSDITEMSCEKFKEIRWKEKKHKSNVTELKFGNSVGDWLNINKYKSDIPDLKTPHSWYIPESKRLTCLRIQDSEFENEQLISKQPGNDEDQNSPDFENKRRRFSQ